MQSRKVGEGGCIKTNPLCELFLQVSLSSRFFQDQKDEGRLNHCWSQVLVVEGEPRQQGRLPTQYFCIRNGLLYYVASRTSESKGGRPLAVPCAIERPLPWTAHGHKYILLLVDYATCRHEAAPSGWQVNHHLLVIFTSFSDCHDFQRCKVTK